MDLTDSIAPKSDQLNADDLITGPVTVTIKDVTKGTPEQPFNFNLVEYPGRAYRPSKSMRRIMVIAWGPDATGYSGHRLTLVRNPEIMFGREKVGGIEIAEMSHIEKALTLSLTASKGRRRSFTVKPLAEPVARDWDAEIASRAGNREALKALWKEAANAGESPELMQRIQDAAPAPEAVS